MPKFVPFDPDAPPLTAAELARALASIPPDTPVAVRVIGKASATPLRYLCGPGALEVGGEAYLVLSDAP